MLLLQADGGVLLRRLGGSNGSGVAKNGCYLKVHYTGRLVDNGSSSAGAASAGALAPAASPNSSSSSRGSSKDGDSAGSGEEMAGNTFASYRYCFHSKSITALRTISKNQK